tara:strand:- start:2913 stop:3131 length:219 start_codon:yes stop_codon:yes gene_type:complete
MHHIIHISWGSQLQSYNLIAGGAQNYCLQDLLPHPHPFPDFAEGALDGAFELQEQSTPFCWHSTSLFADTFA